MTYTVAANVSFTPKWADLSDDEQLAEQVAAYEIVSKFGGEIKSQYALWTDNVLQTIVEYADEESSFKAEMAIQRRGAFIITAQRAVPLEDVLSWQDEVKAVAGK